MAVKKSEKNKKGIKESSETNSKISQEEYEKKVLQLAEKGFTAEKIGEALRKENIHPKEYNRKISKILGEKYVNPDLRNTEKKLERIQKHYEKNSQDKRSMREKDRIFSRIRKIKRYLKISK